MEARLNFYSQAPELMKALVAVKTAIDESGPDKGLMHLVNLRTSQINGCSYCVDMHSREARETGETEQRVYLVSAWKESPLYSPSERAALAWAEQVTLIASGGVSNILYEQALEHFNKSELTKLTIAIGLMNIFNRLCIAFHAIHPVK
ncbi:carboxymuconolactone decarboxylase family protein [Shinella sp. G-2]|uniref:carboxymuconolactone decarboxylase family protein n=1 Tax=Shinella sp. G-2 TaxID=3133141 RepID=UPI003D02F2D5